MIVFPGHSGCFVPVMSFSLSYRRFRGFQFIRGSLPLAFCFVPVMRFCVAVPTVPGFSVYPRQFAFGFLFRPGHAVLCCRIDGSGVFSLSAAVCLWLFDGFLPPVLSSAVSPYNAEEKRRIYELPAAFPCSARQ